MTQSRKGPHLWPTSPQRGHLSHSPAQRYPSILALPDGYHQSCSVNFRSVNLASLTRWEAPHRPGHSLGCRDVCTRLGTEQELKKVEHLSWRGLLSLP